MNKLDLIVQVVTNSKKIYDERFYKKIKNFFEKEKSKELQEGLVGYTRWYNFRDISKNLNIDEKKTIDVLIRLETEEVIGFAETEVNGAPWWYKYEDIYLR